VWAIVSRTGVVSANRLEQGSGIVASGDPIHVVDLTIVLTDPYRHPPGQKLRILLYVGH
jgi:hypothetical protein